VDTGLATGTYSYRIQAYNVSGNSGYSNIATSSSINIGPLATVVSNLASFGRTDFPKGAQTFTTTGAGTITMISGYVGKNGSPSDHLVVSLQATSDGLPDGVNLESYDVGSITATCAEGGTYWSHSFNTPVSTSTRYAVVFTRSGSLDNTNRYDDCGQESNPYAGGLEYYYDTSYHANTSGNDDSALTITVDGIVDTPSSTVIGPLATVVSNLASFGRTDFPKGAQTFTTVATGTITQISGFAGKNGSPADHLVVSLQATSGGLPDGVNLESYDVGSITASCANGGTYWYHSFNTSVNASTTYAVVFTRSGSLDNTNRYDDCGQESNPYAGGLEYYYDTSYHANSSGNDDSAITISMQ
jgi:hypothetical protein